MLSAFLQVCCLMSVKTQACVAAQANLSPREEMSDFLAMLHFYKWEVPKLHHVGDLPCPPPHSLPACVLVGKAGFTLCRLFWLIGYKL